MTLPRSLALIFPLVLLAACDKPAGKDSRSASGEVLEGTISDDMLPLDRLKSQPPLLAPSERATTAKDVEDEVSGETDAADSSSAEEDGAVTPATPTTATTSSSVRGGGSPQG